MGNLKADAVNVYTIWICEKEMIIGMMIVMNKEEHLNDINECIRLECICGDNGIMFLCCKCKKQHKEEIDAVLCCLS